jgi:mono/diheme cytochrome c family protein
MFKTYCGACHGVDGKGDGPAAAALKMPAADLTMLKQKNAGKFPAAKMSYGHARTHFPSAGSRQRDMAKLRIANVLKYLESIQK